MGDRRRHRAVDLVQLIERQAEGVGGDRVLVVLEVHDVGTAVARAELLDELAHRLSRRPRVDDRRRAAVGKTKLAAPRFAEVECLEPPPADQVDAGRIVRHRDGGADAGAVELVREVEEMDRAVAREVVVVDEQDVHAAVRGS